MKTELIFPTIMIVLNIGAAIMYAIKGNIRMMIYWIAAAVLTSCVTYVKEQ